MAETRLVRVATRYNYSEIKLEILAEQPSSDLAASAAMSRGTAADARQWCEREGRVHILSSFLVLYGNTLQL